MLKSKPQDTTYFPSTKMALVCKKWKITSVDEDVKKLESSSTTSEDIKSYSSCGKQFGGFSED